MYPFSGVYEGRLKKALPSFLWEILPTWGEPDGDSWEEGDHYGR
jgi:hypothetical protein